MAGNHKYAVIDDKGNTVFYVKNIKEMEETLRSFGGDVVKMCGRSEYRRFYDGIENSKSFTDYRTVQVF